MATGIILCSCGLMWGLPNVFDFAQDSVVPNGALAQVGAPFERVTTFRYPPFHFILLQVCFIPARGLLKIPSLGGNPKVAATLFILSARLVSAAMALGAMWLILAVGRRLWDEAAGLAASLIFILSPVTLYYAKNANLDIPYVFWLALALFFYVRILQENRRLDYLWLGVSAALAVCTKDQAYGFILFMPLALLPALPKNRREALTRATIGTLGFVLPFVLIHNILFDPAGFWRHVQTVLGPGSQGWREFSPGPVGQLRLLAETALRIADAWTPAGLVLVILGLAAGLRPDEGRRARLAALVPVFSYHLAFLAVIGYVYPRFILPTLLVLALFAGRGAAGLWRGEWLGRRAGRAAAALLIAWLGLAGLSLDYVMSEYPRYEAQKWLDKHASGETRLFYLSETGDMRDMPRFNRPLDPLPVEPSAEALARLQPPAEMLVLSFERGHPATGSRSVRLASILRRRLGGWGIVRGGAARGARSFQERLAAGELGYSQLARFESPIAAWVPDVAESVNRTIVILGRSRK